MMIRASLVLLAVAVASGSSPAFQRSAMPTGGPIRGLELRTGQGFETTNFRDLLDTSQPNADEHQKWVEERQFEYPGKLDGMALEYARNPSTEVPEGMKPGEAGPVIIGKVFEKHKARKKLGDLRPDRLFFKLTDQIREVSGNAQHWILDNLGLLVEKGMPAMIVLCHFPFMSKWVRSEEGDVDADVNGDRRGSQAEPASQVPTSQMLG